MKKDKIIIFGLGEHFKNHQKLYEKTFEIVGYMDNNLNRSDLIKLDQLIEYDYDYILISSPKYYKEIFDQLCNAGVKMIWYDEGFDGDSKILYSPKFKSKILCYANSDIIINLNFDRDIHCYKEVIVNEEYSFYLDESELIVIDVGFNIGTASMYFANMKNVNKVYAFEALDAPFEQGIQNLKINPNLASKIEVYNFGIAGKSSTGKTLYNPNLSGSTSVTHDVVKESWYGDNVLNDAVVADFNVESVEVLIDILNRHPQNKFVLKLDCEGAEYEIIERLDELNALGRFEIIMLEWHFHGYETLVNALLKNNFKIFNQKHNMLDRIGFIRAVK